MTCIWDLIVDWGCGAWKRQTKGNLLMKLAWQAAIYQIWHERNSRIHCNIFPSVEHVIDLVVQDVRNMSAQPFKHLYKLP